MSQEKREVDVNKKYGFFKTVKEQAIDITHDIEEDGILKILILCES